MIYLICGDNNFMLRQRVQAIVDTFVGQHGHDALERRDGADLQRADLDTMLAGASLFSAQKLVIIRDPAAQKPIWELLPDHLARVSDDTIIVLVQPAPDKRTRTYKWLVEHAEVVVCASLSPPQLIDWCVAYAKQKGASISRSVAEGLTGRVGNDQWLIAHEIDKLSLTGDTITEEAVSQYVELSPQATAFDVLDAALAGNTVRVHRALADIRTHEDPYRFSGLLFGHIYALGAVMLGAEGNLGPEAIAKQAGVHPFVVKKNLATARRLDRTQFTTIVAETTKADELLKTSSSEPWVIIDTCLKKIALAVTS
jgi:DNA polymerase III subunit delta